MSDLGLKINAARNVVLVLAYGTLGTVLWQAFVILADVPHHARWHGVRLPLRAIFAVSSLAFFLACSWDHLEMVLHWRAVPDYGTLSHLIPGVAQAVGAVGVVGILYYMLLVRPRL